MSAEPKKEDKGSIFAQPYVDPEKNNVGEKKFFGPKSSKPNFFSSKIRPPSNVKNPGKQEIPSKKTLPPSKIPRISDDGKILKKPYKKEEARPKTPEETPKPPAKSEEPIKKRPSSSVERKRGSEKSPKEKPPGSAQSRPPSRPTPRIKTEPEPERKKPETPERYLPQPTTADKLELFQEVNEPEPTTSKGIRKEPATPNKKTRATEHSAEFELVSIEFENYASQKSSRGSWGSKTVSFDGKKTPTKKKSSKTSQLSSLTNSKSFIKCEKCKKVRSKHDAKRVCSCELNKSTERKQSRESNYSRSSKVSRHSSAILRDVLRSLSMSEGHCHRHSQISFYNWSRHVTPKGSGTSVRKKTKSTEGLDGFVSGSAVLNSRVLEEVYVLTSDNASQSEINIPKRLTSGQVNSLPDVKPYEGLEERHSSCLKGLLNHAGKYKVSFSKSETFAQNPLKYEEDEIYSGKLDLVMIRTPQRNIIYQFVEYEYKIEITFRIFRADPSSTKLVELEKVLSEVPLSIKSKPSDSSSSKLAELEQVLSEVPLSIKSKPADSPSPSRSVKPADSPSPSRLVDLDSVLSELPLSIKSKPADSPSPSRSVKPADSPSPSRLVDLDSVLSELPLSIKSKASVWQSSREEIVKEIEQVPLRPSTQTDGKVSMTFHTSSESTQQTQEIQPKTKKRGSTCRRIFQRKKKITPEDEERDVRVTEPVDETKPKHLFTVRMFGGRKKARNNEESTSSEPSGQGPTYTVQHCTVELNPGKSFLTEPLCDFPVKKKTTDMFEKTVLKEGGEDKLIQRRFQTEPWRYDITIQKSRPETCPTYHSQRTVLLKPKLKRRPLKKRKLNPPNFTTARQVKILQVHPVYHVVAYSLKNITPSIINPSEIPKQHFSSKIGFPFVLGTTEQQKIFYHKERPTLLSTLLKPYSTPRESSSIPVENVTSPLTILWNSKTEKILPGKSAEIKIMWESLVRSEGDLRESQKSVRVPSWVPMDFPKKVKKKSGKVENSVNPVLHKVNKFMVIPKVNFFEGYNYPVILNGRAFVPFSHDDMIVINENENDKSQIVMVRKYK